MTGAVRVVTDATFADVVLGSALPCLVEFRDAASVLEETDGLASFALANRELTCARLDVSGSPQTARTYGVAALPTYLVFRLGAVVTSVADLDELPGLLAGMARSLDDEPSRLADQPGRPSDHRPVGLTDGRTSRSTS